MSVKKPFNAKRVVEEARSGNLKGSELRKAIKRAEDMGLTQVAAELKLFLVSADSFAGDAAPAEVRDRVAQGVSALSAMGHSLSRTKQMFKRHGVIETINRIAKYPAATDNFERLCSAGLRHLTAEAIVLDYPELFSDQAIAVARKRLAENDIETGPK
jgi:hypothetical protein